MRSSLHLGNAFGIPVYLHWTFFLLLGFVALSQLVASGSPLAALGGVVFVSAIFGCIVLHELGHALMARRFGIRTRDVTLLPIGGIARLERMPEDPRQELWVALAGPAVNVVIAGLLGIWLFLTGIVPGGALSLTGGSFLASLMTVNLALAAFNMLPAFPMDGGRVLRALLAQRTGYVEATVLAAKVGRGMAVVFGIVGLFWNPMLVLVALFVWFGAGQEAEAVRRRAAFAGSCQPQPDSETLDPRGEPRLNVRGHPGARTRIYRVGPWLVHRDE